MKRAIAFSFLLACSVVLLADSPDTRVAGRQQPSFLQDLVRMTKAGMSDATVLAYAKAHRMELPPEVSADDLVWLRKSGVSDTVVRYMTAIDVRGDAGPARDMGYDSREAEQRSAAATYSNGDEEGYSDDSYDGRYPQASYDNYAGSYYGDYPVYGEYPYYASYSPYPVYFFVDRNGFFRRTHGRRHGFGGRHGHSVSHGRFGHPHSSRDFDRSRRGSVAAGHRGPGGPSFARGGFSRAPTAARGGVILRGGGGHPAPRGPRSAVAPRGAGFGRSGPAGTGRAGGGFARGPIATSGGVRGPVARPSGGARR